MNNLQKIMVVLLLLTCSCANIFAQTYKVSQAEYYLDTDPGQGNGIAVQATDGAFNSIIENLTKTGISLSHGMHTINIRVKDGNGNWGPVFTTAISVENTLTTRATKITLGEYFWDNDPGQGNGTAMVAFDGNYSDALETAYSSAATVPAAGKHKLSVRVKDADGNWGPTFTTVVSVENPLVNRTIKVLAGECFWDTDPGQGNGTALLAFDGNFNDAIEKVTNSSISTPGLGRHKFSVRVKDPLGNWGPVFTTVVSVENPLVNRSIKVLAAECFWDNDPGQGNGITLLAFDGNFSDAIEAVVNSAVTTPSVLGRHKLSVRARDVLGNWGPVFTTVVSIENPIVNRSIRVASAESFFDVDPGQGNATPLLAFDGNYSDAIEQVVNNSLTTPTTRGRHVLCLRAKDANGNWGPVFTTVLSVEDSLHPRDIRVTAGEYFWDTDPGQGNGTPMFAFDGNYDNAIELNNQAALTSSLSTGFHRLSTRVKDVAGNWGPVFTTAVFIDPCQSTPHPTITPTGPASICQGDSVQLSAPTGYTAYTWVRGTQTVGSGQNFYAHDPGFYTVIVTDGNGCPGASNQVQVNVLTAPTATISGTPYICPSGSTNLTANTGTGLSYQWYRNGAPINGATSYVYTVTQVDTYSVRVTNAGNCFALSSPVIVTNATAPTASISAQGPTTFCPGNSVILSANTGAGLTYQWLRNGSGISLATASTYTASSTGTYSVIVTNSSGCNATSNGIGVNVYAAPTASFTASGTTTFCQGDSVRFNATAGTGYHYQWFKDNNSLPNDTTASLLVQQAGTYYLTVTDGNGCTATSSSSTVTISAPPTATIAAQGATTFCQGGSVVLNANTGTGLTYVWKVDGNGIPFANNASYTATSSGNYTVVVYSNGNCFAESSPVAVTVNPVANANITYGTSLAFCQGDSVVLHAPIAAGYTYQWYRNSNPVATTDSLVANQSGSYYVVVNNSYSCPSTSSAVTVNVAPLPTANITAGGVTRFCQGGSVTLTANTGTSITYQWYQGNTPINFANGISYNATQSGNYHVLITANGSCSATSNTIQVIVDTLPTVSITAGSATRFCQGDSVNLSAQAQGGLSYQWYNSADSITGATASNLTVHTGDTYYVRVSNGNNCRTTSNSIGVLVDTVPQVSILNNTALDFCQGNTVQLYTQTDTGYHYQWYANNGTMANDTNSSITADTSASYSVLVTNGIGCSSIATPVVVTVYPLPVAVAYAADSSFCLGNYLQIQAQTNPNWQYQWYLDTAAISGAFDSTYSTNMGGNYHVVVTNQYGCKDTSGILPITANPSPVALIHSIGPIAICTGDSVVMVVDSGISHAGLSFQWQKDGFDIIGQMDTLYTSHDPGLFTVDVTNNYNCVATTATITVLVDSQPSVTLTSNGPTGFCQGDSVMLSAHATGGTTYTWLRNGVAINNAIDSLYYADTSGNYAVQVNANAGCYKVSDSITVIANTIPVPDLVTTTPTVLCHGDSALLLVNNQTSSWSYVWYNDTTVITSDSTNYLNTLTGGNFAVSVTDTNGCSALSGTISVSFLPSPSVSLAAAGATSFCQGDSVTLHATADTTYQYIWTVAGDTIAGATDSTLLVDATGLYIVIVTDTNHCSNASAGISVVSNPNPTVPTITIDSNVLVSSDTSGNQWYLNDTLIPGATQATYTPLVSGVYSVVVTNGNGCFVQSDTVSFTVTGIGELIDGMEVVIYPNPNNGAFTLQFNGQVTDQYRVTIFDAIGQQVLIDEEPITSNNHLRSYDLRNLASGVYMLNITSAKANYSRKVIIQK